MVAGGQIDGRIPWPIIPLMRCRSSLLACLILASAIVLGADAAADDVVLFDLEGRRVDPWQVHPGAVSVFIFTATECPISNRYAPEIARIHRLFEPRGVAFWLVYADGRETPPGIRDHVESFGYPLAALRDPDHTLVSLTGVTVTPEVAVFDTDRSLRYRGRIDDRYVAFGKSRPRPTVRDLSGALDALLDGRPVAEAETMAIGCYIPPPAR